MSGNEKTLFRLLLVMLFILLLSLLTGCTGEVVYVDREIEVEVEVPRELTEKELEKIREDEYDKAYEEFEDDYDKRKENLDTREDELDAYAKTLDERQSELDSYKSDLDEFDTELKNKEQFLEGEQLQLNQDRDEFEERVENHIPEYKYIEGVPKHFTEGDDFEKHFDEIEVDFYNTSTGKREKVNLTNGTMEIKWTLTGRNVVVTLEEATSTGLTTLTFDAEANPKVKLYTYYVLGDE